MGWQTTTFLAAFRVILYDSDFSLIGCAPAGGLYPVDHSREALEMLAIEPARSGSDTPSLRWLQPDA